MPSFNSSPTAETPLLTVGMAAKAYNVSKSLIRRAHSRGKLQAYVTEGGHRRLSRGDLDQWLGRGVAEEKVGSGGNKIKIACVVRVSGRRQDRRTGKSDSSSLESQTKRLQKYINSRWGSRNVDVKIYKRVGSGMFLGHPVFCSLVSDLIDGKFRNGILLAENSSRVCRFSIELIQQIASRSNTRLVFSMTSEDRSSNEEIVESILNILTHYTSKVNGQKAKAVVQVEIDKKYLAEADEMLVSGYSLMAVCEAFNKKGYKSVKGTVINRTVLSRRLATYRSDLRSAGIKTASEKRGNTANSLHSFLVKHVKRSPDTSISREKLLAAYRSYAKENNLYAISDKNCDAILTKKGYRKGRNQQKAVLYFGISHNYKIPKKVG